MEKAGAVIIGAGVVGLAVASELSARIKDTVIIEKADSFGRETSSRNSEVIHGGMYYPAGSLKARLCVEGRRLLYDFCRDKGIPHKKCGKLIVATQTEEIPALEELLRLGRENGVEELAMLDARQAAGIEPACRCRQALYSPETGILDSHGLMKAYLDICRDNGAVCAFNSEAVAIEPQSGGYVLTVEGGGETISISSPIVINSCGLDSDTLAEKAGFNVQACAYRLHYCKGQYFRVNAEKAGRLKGLVYPVPAPAAGGLGIHATVDLGGGVRLGPDDRYLAGRNKDYSVDESMRESFFSSVKQFLPFISSEDLAADQAGIRPKLQGKGEPFRDFVISEESGRGFPGFVNLIGIESPGLTASPAIARMVTGLLRERC